MKEIQLPAEQREAIRVKLLEYCEEHFNLTLEQFDGEFFTDFIIGTLGVAIYNAGIDEAISTHQKYCDRIQEEMDLQKIW